MENAIDVLAFMLASVASAATLAALAGLALRIAQYLAARQRLRPRRRRSFMTPRMLAADCLGLALLFVSAAPIAAISIAALIV